MRGRGGAGPAGSRLLVGRVGAVLQHGVAHQIGGITHVHRHTGVPRHCRLSRGGRQQAVHRCPVTQPVLLLHLHRRQPADSGKVARTKHIPLRALLGADKGDERFGVRRNVAGFRSQIPQLDPQVSGAEEREIRPGELDVVGCIDRRRHRICLHHDALIQRRRTRRPDPLFHPAESVIDVVGAAEQCRLDITGLQGRLCSLKGRLRRSVTCLQVDAQAIAVLVDLAGAAQLHGLAALQVVQVDPADAVAAVGQPDAAGVVVLEELFARHGTVAAPGDLTERVVAGGGGGDAGCGRRVQRNAGCRCPSEFVVVQYLEQGRIAHRLPGLAQVSHRVVGLVAALAAGIPGLGYAAELVVHHPRRPVLGIRIEHCAAIQAGVRALDHHHRVADRVAPELRHGRALDGAVRTCNGSRWRDHGIHPAECVVVAVRDAAIGVGRVGQVADRVVGNQGSDSGRTLGDGCHHHCLDAALLRALPVQCVVGICDGAIFSVRRGDRPPTHRIECRCAGELDAADEVTRGVEGLFGQVTQCIDDVGLAAHAVVVIVGGRPAVGIRIAQLRGPHQSSERIVAVLRSLAAQGLGGREGTRVEGKHLGLGHRQDPALAVIAGQEFAVLRMIGDIEGGLNRCRLALLAIRGCGGRIRVTHQPHAFAECVALILRHVAKSVDVMDDAASVVVGLVAPGIRHVAAGDRIAQSVIDRLRGQGLVAGLRSRGRPTKAIVGQHRAGLCRVDVDGGMDSANLAPERVVVVAGGAGFIAPRTFRA